MQGAKAFKPLNSGNVHCSMTNYGYYTEKMRGSVGARFDLGEYRGVAWPVHRDNHYFSMFWEFADNTIHIRDTLPRVSACTFNAPAW